MSVESSWMEEKLDILGDKYGRSELGRPKSRLEQCFPTCGPRTPGGPRVIQKGSAG
jgi:hypothetical protein